MSLTDDDFSPEEAFRLFPRPTPTLSRYNEAVRQSNQFDVTNAFIHKLIQPASHINVLYKI